MNREALIARLRQGAAGHVAAGEIEVEPYARDFGGFVRRVPLAAVPTASEAEVRHALEAARDFGVPATVRGAGHSCHGQCLSDGGVVLVNDSAEAPIRRLAEGRIEVQARSRWSGIVRALHREGRTLPVVTNYLGTTVGGTLSVGGFGIASIADGAQIDHVERLRLVLPSGEPAECSRTENPELFALALGGLGQAGVIETAVIRTIPWRPRVRLSIAAHDSLPGIVESLRPFAAEGAEVPDCFFAEWTGGRFTATRGVAVEEGGTEVNTLFDFGESGGAPEGMSHIWSDYCFDFGGLAEFAEHVETGMSLGLLTPHLSRVYLLCLAPPPAGLRSRFDPRPEQAGARGFGIGLYYTVPAGEADAVRRAQSIQDALLDNCLRLGGRPYRSGYHRRAQ